MVRKKINNYSGRNFKKKREVDKITKNERSALMSKIRSRDTKFEEDFIRGLKKITNVKFKCNCQLIKGKPDIVFNKRKVCVFLDSDFWHGWQYPRWRHLLKNDFWREKIEANRQRDKRVSKFLRQKGWKVLRFWEHGIKRDEDAMLKKVKLLLS
ncbi:MAG: very short patch repair endonuclease [Candidatus Omnitrophica bacterium CG11_big_fil_rev_8_21_14_0_20_42_13]|uniref:Very short patch repair endonuclease n=1 Tax=Candidatus Ghiorseimicrobium undicola TaxID=1974746 RepID=A0A2H0LVS9_9BACT|nr:MAG: very short patch repair endonuclease [Candidatus Omnitrophica bacterium CG11_big_fil_rev_8_21_14_0_20_42_13]